MTQVAFVIKFRTFLAALPSYNSNEAAAAVLAVGRPYWAGPGHISAAEGRLLKVV